MFRQTSQDIKTINFNKKTIKGFLLIIVLSFIDSVLTLYLVSTGWAIEVSPLPKYLLSLGDKEFFLVKILTTQLACLWGLWRIRSHKKPVPKLWYIIILSVVVFYVLIVSIQVISYLLLLIL